MRAFKCWGLLVAGFAVGCAEPRQSTLLGSHGESLGAADATLTVSLTFDDTEAEQLAAAAALEAHGLLGTFYLNSPRLHDGSARVGSEFFSVEDARALQERGHEIGGHTLSHPSLPGLSELERRREVSNDRRELLRLGLDVRSLAYPYGDVEADLDPEPGASLSDIVAEAGYASARDTNGFDLGRCGVGPETLPPQDVYRLRSARSVNNVPPAPESEPAPPPDSAETLLGWMDHAASCGGGWLPLIFHHVRPDCSAAGAPDYCFELSELDRLAEALASGERCFEPEGSEGVTSCYGVAVRTVSEALGHTEVPGADEVFALRNAALERTLDSGATECMQHLQGDQGTASFTRSTQLARSGEASEHVAIAPPFVSGAELIIARDFGACSPYATVGTAYDLALHYRADPAEAAPTLRFVVYRLTADYAWQQWTVGMPFAAAAPGEWVRRSFTTGPVPDSTLAFSFGLRLESAGGVSVDDFEIAPAAE
jgi:hypothetical protein